MTERRRLLPILNAPPMKPKTERLMVLSAELELIVNALPMYVSKGNVAVLNVESSEDSASDPDTYFKKLLKNPYQKI